MQIFLISTMGDGFAGKIDVADGYSVSDLIKDQNLPDKADIMVNSKAVPNSYVFKENDKVTITPGNIEAGK